MKKSNRKAKAKPRPDWSNANDVRMWTIAQLLKQDVIDDDNRAYTDFVTPNYVEACQRALRGDLNPLRQVLPNLEISVRKPTGPPLQAYVEELPVRLGVGIVARIRRLWRGKRPKINPARIAIEYMDLFGRVDFDEDDDDDAKKFKTDDLVGKIEDEVIGGYRKPKA